MKISLMDQYSDEEFAEILKDSFSYKECLQKLGYHSNSGAATERLKRKIIELNLDVSHFQRTTPVLRTPENIFIKDSTASQKVLREWYKKGQYTPYICDVCGQEPFWNGKELTLILDHKNGYNTDDRLENLHWVCPNCNYQLDTTNGKNIRHNQHKVVNACVDCGKPIGQQSIRCRACSAKHSQQIRIDNGSHFSNFISRDELKQLIRNTPFVQIGARYGVSDNAVRKWCDAYNLPRRTRDIKALSDEEWNNI